MELQDEDFDNPIGQSSGASVIFGTTGGVIEATLRTACEWLTGKPLNKIEFHELRSFRAFVSKSWKLRAWNSIGIANGLGNTVPFWKKSVTVKLIMMPLKLWLAPAVASTAEDNLIITITGAYLKNAHVLFTLKTKENLCVNLMKTPPLFSFTKNTWVSRTVKKHTLCFTPITRKETWFNTI